MRVSNHLPRSKGGSLADLRRFINVGSDADFILIVAWLVSALHPSGPYPVLALNGEHGSTGGMAKRRELRTTAPPCFPSGAHGDKMVTALPARRNSRNHVFRPELGGTRIARSRRAGAGKRKRPQSKSPERARPCIGPRPCFALVGLARFVSFDSQARRACLP